MASTPPAPNCIEIRELNELPGGVSRRLDGVGAQLPDQQWCIRIEARSHPPRAQRASRIGILHRSTERPRIE
jgi:hypothetical protein